jgi:plasmid maintenance system killer protein
MELVFASRKLRRCYESQAEAKKSWPETVAVKYALRISQMGIVKNFDDLQRLPALHVHPLKGKRKEQWSLTIHERWRLIFKVDRIDGVEIIHILEVSNHYGD